ncbi:MAG: hypothetical protein AAF576_07025 [Pseudomonadota bacterium]
MFKKFAIAATVVALSSTAALASNSFGHQDAFEEGSHTVELDLVRASDAGTVVLESLRGDVIASADVNAGANANVRVKIPGQGVNDDVVAKLIVNGAVQDEIRIQAR